MILYNPTINYQQLDHIVLSTKMSV